jgi:glycosyltransferase involved in cell wall biosynthesis
VDAWLVVRTRSIRPREIKLLHSQESVDRPVQSTKSVPRISLVIPAYNEQALLPALLETVEVARRRYSFGSDEIEVVVADNASSDSTASIALSHGCKVASVSKRSIAAARNGGATLAKGRVLAFVDADSLIHPETFNAIERAMSTEGVLAGATGVRAGRMSPAIAVLVAMTVPFRAMGIDSGVVFCWKEDWKTVGGFDETQLISEDIRFLFALKKLARARKQRLLCPKGAKATTSTRKFDDNGDWRFLGQLIAAPLLKTFRPKAFERWVQAHWYEERSRE